MHPYGNSILDLVRAGAPGRGDFVALVHAYSDTSSAEDYLVLGSYLFRKSKIAPFERDWRRILRKYDLPFFRMSACNSGAPPFDKLDESECIDAATMAIKAIKDHAEVGHYVTIRKRDFHEIITPDGVARNPFSLLIHMYLLMVNLYMDETNPRGKISHFFEAGDDGEKDAGLVLNVMFAQAERREQFRYRSHTFIQKADSMPTQAADVLAWHACKHRRRLDNGFTNMRGDFNSLYGGLRHRSFDADAEKLRNMVSAFEQSIGGPGANRLAGIVLRESNPKILRDKAALERLIREG